jgi:DNA (cytosine-5)-methyltransferase 1
LRAAVTRIETNPAYAFMPIRLHTHDEILVEVDEGRAEEAKAILRREMLTLPDWAAGLPLQSEEQAHHCYSKVKTAPPAASPAPPAPLAFSEFFCGVGCARIGLGPGWRCRYANDISATKAETYRRNFGADHLHVGDIRDVAAASLPTVDLMWGSPPCVDLSEAGKRGGIDAERSGAVWPFLALLRALREAGRGPKLVVVENVQGLATGRDGRDLIALIAALSAAGYLVGGSIVDAALFVPQSRPRVFMIAVRNDLKIPIELKSERPEAWCSPTALVKALEGRGAWWPKLEAPGAGVAPLEACLEADASGWVAMDLVEFGPPSRLALQRLNGGQALGTTFRRTRKAGPVWEVRFDGRAGALRVASGGSSRQSWVRVENGRISRRLFTPREAARIMGLPDDFHLPPGNDGLTAVGDGICPPVVRHLAKTLFEPILRIGGPK